MKAEKIKCKDFVYVSRPKGSRLLGQENLWVCEIYYKGRHIATESSKTATKRWVSIRVRAANYILEARKKSGGEVPAPEVRRAERN